MCTFDTFTSWQWPQSTASVWDWTLTDYTYRTEHDPIEARIKRRAVEFREWVRALAVPWADSVRAILRARPCSIGRVTILFQPRWSARRWRSTT